MRVIEASNRVIAMEYTPCGRFLVYAEFAKRDERDRRSHIRLHWHGLDRGNDLWEENLARAYGISFALFANRIATHEGVGDVSIYECKESRAEVIESQVPGPDDSCMFSDYSKDGRYFAWVRRSREHPSRVSTDSIIWQDATNKAIHGELRPLHGVMYARYSNDSLYLATFGAALTLWSMANHESVATWREPKEREKRVDRVTTVRFAPDTSTLFICSPYFGYVWNPGADKVLFEIPMLRDRPLKSAYSPSGLLLAIGRKRTIEIWDIRTGKCVRTYEWPMGDVGCLAFAPDGLTMAAGGDRRVVIWDLDEM
jgi:hypothetical protein